MLKLAENKVRFQVKGKYPALIIDSDRQQTKRLFTDRSDSKDNA